MLRERELEGSERSGDGMSTSLVGRTGAELELVCGLPHTAGRSCLSLLACA